MVVTARSAARRGRRFGACVLGVALLALVAGAPAAFAAKLTVTITGVHSDKGNVYVALFNDADTFPDGDHALRRLKVRASTAPIVVTFDGIAPGSYALACYHDEELLGHFKTNWFGYPLDGYALSNGIHPVVSSPTFAEAAFPVASPAAQVTLHVKY